MAKRRSKNSVVWGRFSYYHWTNVLKPKAARIECRSHNGHSTLHSHRHTVRQTHVQKRYWNNSDSSHKRHHIHRHEKSKTRGSLHEINKANGTQSSHYHTVCNAHWNVSSERVHCCRHSQPQLSMTTHHPEAKARTEPRMNSHLAWVLLMASPF